MGGAGHDIELVRVEAIVHHLSKVPLIKTKTVVLEATVHPHAVQAVIRLLEEESEAPLAAVARGCLLEPVNLLEVEEHVVGDVAAGDKGRMGDDEDVIGHAAYAQGKDARHDTRAATPRCHPQHA